MTLDSPPLVSIIIPLYNAEETIDSCLQSCLGQTYKNLEIIVIDDGSSDNSRAIVQGFDHAYPQIRTFRQNRGGVTEARNYGMRKATGQYLFFMDADDDLPAQSLEVLVERAVETQADITAGTTLHQSNYCSNRPFMTLDSPPLVSIIIPLYNAEETIDSCLQSCLGQTYKNLEIIVIDDGSSDNSRAIVQGFDHAYPQIRTFRQNRGGVTEARNYGMRKATGQYLFFMDADDDLPAQSLEVLVERAVETQADITAGTTLHLTEKRELIARMNYIPFSTLSGEEWLTTIRKTWQGHLWGLLFRKSLFEHPLLCPLSLKIGEDLLQVTQLAMRSHLVAMTPQTVYHYIKRETSAINSRQFPSDIRQGDEILFVETMLHLQKKASTRRMRTECRLLSLFAVLNLPSSGYRSKLLHHFRTLYLSYLLTDRHLIKTLWNISPRLHIGMILDCIK